MLNVNEGVVIDESIAGYKVQTHESYTSRFNNNDEIRINLPEDLTTLPSESYIYCEGLLVKDEPAQPPATTTKFVNNGILDLFSEIRLEVNGRTIDTNIKPGLTSTMKGIVSFNASESLKYQNAGWFPTSDSKIVENGKFSACIPLKMIFGFAEDYKKVMVQTAQELVLIRSNSDVDALISTSDEKAKVIINKIAWRVPHIIPGLRQEAAMADLIKKGKDIQVAHRTWELHSFPALQDISKHSYTIKTATKLESPRYVILGFQTNRAGQFKKNNSQFDKCHFNNIRIYLNNERFPYENVNNNFNNNQYSTLYEMFAQFRTSYYFGEKTETDITPEEFKNKYPLIIVDCSRQKLGFQTQAVTVRVEFDTGTPMPANTMTHVLLINDRIFTYNPSTKAVRQM
jgi:hypothetical protein